MLTDFTVRTATTLEEVEALRPFWSPLNSHPDADIDFFSFLVCTELGVEKPFVLILGQDGEPRAILVGRLQRTSISLKVGYMNLFRLGLRQLTFIADGPDGYLGESSPEIARVFAQQILKLLKTGIADRAVLYKLRESSELCAVSRKLPSRLQRDYTCEVSPRWAMRVPLTFEEVFKQASSKRRWQLRHILRVIEKEHNGRVICKIFQKHEDIECFCTDAESIARYTYQRGLGVGFMDSHADRQRLELWAEKGWLKAYVLYAVDKPIAFWSGVVYRNVWYSIWTGYDPAYQNYHPGTVLLLRILEDLCGSNVNKVDFGFGQAEYKQRFGDQKQTEAFVNIHARSVRGMSASLLVLTGALINRAAKAIVGRFKVLTRIKRLWRRTLATAATKQEARIVG